MSLNIVDFMNHAPAAVGIELIDSTTASASSGSSISISYPASILAGDLLFLIGSTGDSRDWNTNADFTTEVTGNSTSSTSVLYVGSRVATGSETGTTTLAVSGETEFSILMLQLRNAAVDVVGALYETGNDLTDQVPASITVTEDSSWLMAFLSSREVQEWTSSEAMTPVYEDTVTRPDLSVFREDVDSGATGSRTFTKSNTNRSNGVLISISPA